MTWFWVSTNWATGGVEVTEDMTIKTTPPIWRKFIGQPFGNLTGWLAKKSTILEVIEQHE